ncbi:MAG: (2Fe-2S)-binding protein [Gammaproteobacteria bacterium]|nr:(2Fe-2S)-binding protein [Gammaproteobacteria bacterium]
MDRTDRSRSPGGPSRRDFLKGAAAGAAGAGLLTSQEAPAQQAAGGAPLVKGQVTVTLQVNGQARQVRIEPRTTLLDALRDGRDPQGTPLDVTGPKRICDRGSCGGCTVHLDGRTVYACSVLAIDAVGHEIRTIEGLASGEKLHVLQDEFIKHDGLMCGFCTPGFVMSAAKLLETNPSPSRQEIQQALDGNICRCGTYVRVFEAVEAAAARLRQGG